MATQRLSINCLGRHSKHSLPPPKQKKIPALRWFKPQIEKMLITCKNETRRESWCFPKSCPNCVDKWFSSIVSLCSLLVKHSKSGLNTHWKWFGLFSFSQLNLLILNSDCVAGCHGDDPCYLGNCYNYHVLSFLYLSDAKYVILHGLRHLSWYTTYAILMYNYNHILSSPKYYPIGDLAPRIAGLHKICR